jgi:Skp family chaperone for outer membrane proteins
MKTMMKAVALAAATVALSAGVSVPALAQSKLGVAVVNLDQAVAQSNAFRTAMTQMQTTYKASIDQFNTRQTALQTELKQKQDAFQVAANTAGQNPTPAQRAALQTQYDALQQRAQAAQAELQRIGAPIELARQFVIEQISEKVPEALRGAMTEAKVDLVLKGGAVEAYQPGVDITATVVAKLNTVVPSVGIVPPNGWQPGQQGAAAPAAAPAAPAAATPPAAKPQTR